MRLGPCTVTVVTIDARTGVAVNTKAHAASAIAYCIDESNKRCLVVGTDDRSSREFAVAGGVKLLTRFVHEGKATLTLVRRSINLMISQAEPVALREWRQTLASGRPPAPPRSSRAVGAGAFAAHRDSRCRITPPYWPAWVTIPDGSK